MAKQTFSAVKQEKPRAAVKGQESSNQHQKILKDELAEVIHQAVRDNRSYLMEHESKEILEGIGIATTGYLVARSEDEALAFCDKIGFPVVLKIVSPDVVHKTDAGGVKLNLMNAADVRKAYRDILETFKYQHIEGVAVQRMAPSGIEAIIGVARDPGFGPVIMFGLVGVCGIGRTVIVPGDDLLRGGRVEELDVGFRRLARALRIDVPVDDGDGRFGQDRQRGGDDVELVLAEFLLKYLRHAIGQLFVVKHGRGPFRDFNNWLWRAGSGGNALGLSFDGSQDMFTDLIRIAADRELQMAGVADDVVLGAAVNRTDRDHGGLGWLVLARDECLQVNHQLCCHDDRVDRGVRISAVAAATRGGPVGDGVGGGVAVADAEGVDEGAGDVEEGVVDAVGDGGAPAPGPALQAVSSRQAPVASATCLLDTSPSPRDRTRPRMPSSA